MLARLSSKGQLVIPKAIRQTLGLWAGAQFKIHLEEGKIILEPIVSSPIDALYGKFGGVDLIAELETEHRQEIEDEEPVCP